MNNSEKMKRYINSKIGNVNQEGIGKYSYILSKDDIAEAYVRMRNELGYPLMIDSKYRRAIVYNKKGLEEKIMKLVNDCIAQNIREIEMLMANDIAQMVTNQLKGISQPQNINRGATNRLAKALGKGLIKGIGKLIDEITDTN